MTRKILFVHAHPDDESSQTSATMARYVAEGANVTLVTCTLGEYGEIVAPELAEVLGSDTLGAHRLEELGQAMAALGVTDYVRLGGDGTYHDSGMVEETPDRIVPDPDRAPNAFWDADLLEAANHLVAILRDRRPDVVVLYNQFGSYGHPDHIQAHRVGTYAITLAGIPSYAPQLGEPWQVRRTLWHTFAADDMRRLAAKAKAAGVEAPFGEMTEPADLPPMVSETADIAAHVVTGPWVEKKMAALKAHHSQVNLEDQFWALMTTHPDPEDLGECYRYAGGVPFPAGGPATDLFAGLD